MNRIKILSDDLVSKIAAGEVVERPASVVKELLDNAIDSGANHITIEIEEGGIKKILVADNGTGMSKEDAELAFKPHATSKISTEEDLLNINSYGFRGEALSSISAVSKVTLKTRPSADNLGTEIKIEGGKTVSVAETGAPAGTSILVEELFYNIPARIEFLKSPQAEYRAILDITDAHAIANPKIGFTLTNNGRTVYSFPKDHQMDDRLREIFGIDTFEKLLPIFFEHPHIEIYGFAGKPEIATENKKQQYIFVNGRRIFDKSIAFAVKEAYSSLIAKDAYPLYTVFIDVPANIVDVNVHPRKEEVKFSNSQLIFNSVKDSIKKALDRANLTPGSQHAAGTAGSSGFPPYSSPFGEPPPLSPTYGSPFGSKPAGGFSKGSSYNSPWPKPAPARGKPSISKPPAFNSPYKPPASGGFGTGQNQAGSPPFGSPPKDPFGFDDFGYDYPPYGSQGQQAGMDLNTQNSSNIMQIHNLYVISEAETGIMVYDQHALHERIIYERLKAAHGEQKEEGNIQMLLTPIVVNLSVQEAEIINEYITTLEEAGFKIENFGGHSYKITQVPAILADKDLKILIHELIEDLENTEGLKEIDSKSDKMLTYLACRTAYKSGDLIPQEEISAMIEKLNTAEIPYTCPHGRPLKVEITFSELEKMFKRK